MGDYSLLIISIIIYRKKKTDLIIYFILDYLSIITRISMLLYYDKNIVAYNQALSRLKKWNKGEK